MADGFYTDKQGRVRPLTRRKSTTTVVAATVAIGVAATGGSLGAAGSAGSAASSFGETVLSRPLQAQVKKGRSHAAKGNPRKAWKELGLRRLDGKVRSAVECAAVSYGEVREFFLRTPCRSVTRIQLPLRDAEGGEVVVAIAWVDMPTRGSRKRLQTLVDTHGTGNVIARTAAALGEPGVRYAGHHYDSRPKGRTLVVAEAESPNGRVDDSALDAAVRVATAFPAP